jgi:NifB/MoaA-like Fe-S oxidoreductase
MSASLAVEAADGPAARAGLRAGDCIVAIAGAPVQDVLDLEMAAADGAFAVTVVREGHPLSLHVLPHRGESHGITLADELGVPPRICRNHCRFCFVDQLPLGLRPSLAVKDDDYRLSFLHGNFTTLSNMDDADLARVEELRLSPLYVSLHDWDDERRARLMGRAARGTRRALLRLAAAGSVLHLQVVVCPGWNDGLARDETVRAVAELAAVRDIGVVPVSLASEGGLRRVTADDARHAIAQIEALQRRLRAQRGVSFVHAADEMYLLAGVEPPAADAPAQFENGIGLCAALREEAAGLAASGLEGLGARQPCARRRADRGQSLASIQFLCGVLALPVIDAAIVTLARGLPGGSRNLPTMRARAVTNRLFGRHVTVTGLLGGAEVLDSLRAEPLAEDEWLFAPRAFLPSALGRTLDDVPETDLQAACGGRLVVAEGLAAAFATLAS